VKFSCQKKVKNVRRVSRYARWCEVNPKVYYCAKKEKREEERRERKLCLLGYLYIHGLLSLGSSFLLFLDTEGKFILGALSKC
jgi:hypothetical protein